MSRIGKLPVTVPAGVDVTIDGTDHSISKLMRKGKLVLTHRQGGFRSFDRGAGLYQRRQLFVPV